MGCMVPSFGNAQVCPSFKAAGEAYVRQDNLHLFALSTRAGIAEQILSRYFHTSFNQIARKPLFENPILPFAHLPSMQSFPPSSRPTGSPGFIFLIKSASAIDSKQVITKIDN